MSNSKLIKQQEAAFAKIMERQHEFEQWRARETENIESKRQNLRRQARQIENERMQLNIAKEHFYRQQEIEADRKKREEHLLETKRRILQEELYRFAEEKRMFEQKKNLYDQRDFNRKEDFHQKEDFRLKPRTVQGTIFFSGVNSKSSLKKRYKDLLKIYHPDNKCGDTDAIKEINREYNSLLEAMQEKD